MSDNQQLVITKPKEEPLLILKQLPIIEQKLKGIKPEIQKDVDAALALDVNTDTVKNVKKVRAALNKRRKEIDRQRIRMKTALDAPYDAFMQNYADCVTRPYEAADIKLRDRISAVEKQLKNKMRDKIVPYFNEYAESKNLQWVTFDYTNITIGLSDTEAKLKRQCTQTLDSIADDIMIIRSQEHADEVMVEYKSNGLNPATAIRAVEQRYWALKQEQVYRVGVEKTEERQAQAEANVQNIIASSAPVVQPVEQDKQEEEFEMTFTVTATMPRLKALKQFLIEGGYKAK